jgi:hypothetical protein
VVTNQTHPPHKKPGILRLETQAIVQHEDKSLPLLRNLVQSLATLVAEEFVDVQGTPDEAALLTDLGQKYIARHRARLEMLETDVKLASERAARAEIELADARSVAHTTSKRLETTIRETREELARGSAQRDAERIQLMNDADARLASTVIDATAALSSALAQANAKLARAEHEAKQHTLRAAAHENAKYAQIVADADAKVKAAWRTADAKMTHVHADAAEARAQAAKMEERLCEVERRVLAESRRADDAERARAVAEKIAGDFEQMLRG